MKVWEGFEVSVAFTWSASNCGSPLEV